MAVRLNNGIVYDATFKRIFVKDITNLTNDQVAVLQCGDEVVKLTGCQKHTYLVTFKKDDEGMCLTYHDATYSETVSYDLVDGVWTYNSTDTSESSGGGSGGGGDTPSSNGIFVFDVNDESNYSNFNDYYFN